MNKVEHRYGPGDVRLVTASFSTHRFEPHEPAEFAIAVISRGVEAVRHRGADEVAPAGSLLLLDAEVLHAGRPAVPEGWDYRVFYAPAALLAELGGRVPRFRSPTVQDPALARRLASVHRLLPRASELEAGERLAEAFTSLLTRYGGGQAPDRPSGGVARRIQRRLAEDLTSTPGLEELADYAQMPRFQLLRAFRRETGTTPHRYLRQLRLRNAQQLLTAGVLRCAGRGRQRIPRPGPPASTLPPDLRGDPGIVQPQRRTRPGRIARLACGEWTTTHHPNSTAAHC